jgi:hypothetical protein
MGSFTCVNPYVMTKKLVIAILCCVLILLVLLLFLLFPRPTPMTATPQDPGFRLGEITKLWYPKNVPVTDGFTFRYRLWDKYDTAIYFRTGADTFDVVTTFKKVTGSKPPVVLPDIITIRLFPLWTVWLELTSNSIVLAIRSNGGMRSEKTTA